MKTYLISLAIGLATIACSPYRITQNQVDTSAAWSAYRTYAFVDTSRIDAAPGNTYRAVMEQLKQAVAAELKRRGYQPSADNPDLLVNLGAVVNEKTQTRPTTIYEAPYYIGQRRYSWQSQEVPVRTYEEGTVDLHIVDAQRQALIWDVAVSSVLSKRGVTPAQIGEAVARAFSRFPGRG